MKDCPLALIGVSTKMSQYAYCVAVLFLAVFTCNKCDEIDSVNQFLVTISGSNLTAAEVLDKLRQLLTTLHGEASDIDECRLVMDICNLNATCVNTLGSYQCLCDRGHVTNGSLSGPCLDVNECLLGISNCSDDAVCTNLPGSFSCACKVDFTGNGYECTDIDECLDTTERCQPNAKCDNQPGTYSCTCEGGYEKHNGSTSDCVDVDECQLGLHNCSPLATCRNLPGLFTCLCNAGYTGDGTECVDQDECADASQVFCHEKAECLNIPGSFQCVCANGYKGNGTLCEDVNECDSTVCAEDSECVNTDGSYSCQCLTGFLEKDSMCQDIDECSIEVHGCPSDSTCHNLPGSYVCTCDDGFTGTGSECTDIDECKVAKCDHNAECLNFPGTFLCICSDGYSGNGTHCKDINECDELADNCNNLSECQNTDGSYICECIPGYEGEGKTCMDADECAQNPCQQNATCLNSIGSFECKCLGGFTEVRGLCQDVDECSSLAPCHEDATCHNVIGSFSCSCTSGYVGDGINCEDFDECSDGQVCFVNSHCINAQGSYSCECNVGFNKVDDHCEDLDECTSGLSDCDLTTQICSNTVGSFVCGCRDDMRWDGAECRPLPNECATGTHDCHPLATCIHEGASYTCVCNDTSYDDHSKGRNCISPVKVSCTSTSIYVEVVAEYYEMKRIFLHDLHLADHSCVGVKSSESDKHWVFEIDDLTSCGTTVRKNQTHVTYSNVLSNAVKSGVYLGTFISVPFSCSYPSNLTVALPTPYFPQTNVISISGPNGTGTFVVEMHIYSDATYTSISNETVYATTDTLYVQVKLTADAEKLVLLINECWATPTSSGSDPNAYTFIDNGCPIPGRVADTVRVTSNGLGKTAHFQTQVFGFVDYNTTYLHCTVDLCSQHGGNACEKACNRSRRYVISQSRNRRSADPQFLSLGPFLSGTRSSFTNHVDGFFARHFATIVSGFVSAVLMMLCLVAYVLVSGHRLQLRILRRFSAESPANNVDRVRSGSNATAIRNLHAVMASDEPQAEKCYEHTGRGTSTFECSRV